MLTYSLCFGVVFEATINRQPSIGRLKPTFFQRGSPAASMDVEGAEVGAKVGPLNFAPETCLNSIISELVRV